jgi:hypothetical protein
LSKIILIGFGLLFALAIPIYFIVGRFINLQETEKYISQVSERRTMTAIPGSTQSAIPTKTLFPTETPTPTITPTPTPSSTPTEILVPDTGNSHNLYLDKVVHLDERGPQTMVKFITVEPPIEDVFRAEVYITWNTYKYSCFILGDENEQLFCLGLRLPEYNQATIKVFEIRAGGEEVLVFEAGFEVPAAAATATPRPRTNTPKPGPSNTPPPTSTFTPTPTDTPDPTNTPLPTATPTNTPTNTPKAPPTAPWEPTPTP